MPHVNDNKNAKLGGTAHTDDLEQASHTLPQTNDGWMAIFKAGGATSDNWNTAALEWLKIQGATSDNLTDAWQEVWLI